MKKKIIVIAIVVLVIILGSISIYLGFFKNDNVTSKDKAIEGNKVVYTVKPSITGPGISEISYVYTVYPDKRIEIHDYNKDDVFEKKLSNDEYNEIIDYACSEKFTSLDKDVSDRSIMDGSYEIIEVYKDNELLFKTEGWNPTNRTFAKLREMINSYNK